MKYDEEINDVPKIFVINRTCLIRITRIPSFHIANLRTPTLFPLSGRVEVYFFPFFWDIYECPGKLF